MTTTSTRRRSSTTPTCGRFSRRSSASPKASDCSTCGPEHHEQLGRVLLQVAAVTSCTASTTVTCPPMAKARVSASSGSGSTSRVMGYLR